MNEGEPNPERKFISINRFFEMVDEKDEPELNRLHNLKRFIEDDDTLAEEAFDQ